MTPAETNALYRAWRKKERRESARFAQIVSALTGSEMDELMPPEDGETA